jgi:hypothetical protein
MDLTCSDIQVYLGDAIDRTLPRQIESAFHAHLTVCRACRNSYELEQLAKFAVRSKLRRMTTPPQVYTSVLSALRSEYPLASSSGEKWWKWSVSRRAMLPALAGGIALVVFALFFQTPQNRVERFAAHTAANDLINQTYRNFLRVRSGELKPSLTSCFPESIQAYFIQQDTRFAVNVLPLPNSEWYGAIANQYGNVKLAHVIYKLGDEWIYVSQVHESAALSGEVLSLPPAAKEALEKSGWYTDPLHPDCSVVVWKVNGTLCTAVSTMKKERLLAMLTGR